MWHYGMQERHVWEWGVFQVQTYSIGWWSKIYDSQQWSNIQELLQFEKRRLCLIGNSHSINPFLGGRQSLVKDTWAIRSSCRYHVILFCLGCHSACYLTSEDHRKSSICIIIYICMHTCIHPYIHTNVCVCIYIHMYMFTYRYMYIHISMHTCICMCMYTYCC